MVFKSIYEGVEKGGLFIGNILEDGTDGPNVRIGACEWDIATKPCIDMRSGDTVLARYTDDAIYLGMRSSNSTISLCGDVGSISISPLSEVDDWWTLNLRSQNSIALSSMGTMGMSTDYSYGTKEAHTTFTMGSDSPYNDTGDVSCYGMWSVDAKSGSNHYVSSIDMSWQYIQLGYMATDVFDFIKLDDEGILLDVLSSKSGSVQVNGSLKVTGDLVFGTNYKQILGTQTDGTVVDVFQPKNSSNNTVIGWGNYDRASGNTNLYGNEVQIGCRAAGRKTFRPYYHGVDSFTTTFRGAGYVTGSTQGIYFTIPLAKPIIGNPTVSMTSTNGFVLRQGGVYTHGSAYSSNKYTYAKPSSYTASIDSSGNCVLVYAYFSSTNNSCTNNSPIGIDWTGTITFAYG